MAFDATDFTAPVRMLDRDPKSLTEPRERLEYLRDFLRELPPESFDYMNSFGGDPECKTPACILGWAERLSQTSHPATYDWMGLSGEQGSELCFSACRGSGKLSRELTGQHAANVLDHLIRTGEVNWSVA